jgi:hypothetical protein
MANKRDRSKLVETIRRALVSSHKSRYLVGKESGVSPAALCRFVQGKGLKVESLERVAESLGLEIIAVKRKGR